MKRGTLITGCIVVSCFFAGIFLAEYIRSNKQVENLPPSLQSYTQDLTGKPSPGFSLMDVSGQSRNVSEWQGKVLVINFWATWCPPCLEEIPHFINLQDKYGDQGLQFLGIALEGVDDVTSFANRLGINYPLLVGEQEVIKLAGKLGNRIGGLPYTVILDRSGIINFIKVGPLSVSEAEQVITSLL
jgi:thiol-disulfide isomerase/thioredoxin